MMISRSRDHIDEMMSDGDFNSVPAEECGWFKEGRSPLDVIDIDVTAWATKVQGRVRVFRFLVNPG